MTTLTAAKRFEQTVEAESLQISEFLAWGGGTHPVMIRGYSWFCAWELLGPYGVLKISAACKALPTVLLLWPNISGFFKTIQGLGLPSFLFRFKIGVKDIGILVDN